jgi:Domain of unknown function (DUF4157)
MTSNKDSTQRAKSAVVPVHAAVLQRKCACGGSSGLTGSCSECEKKKLVSQPLQTNMRINEPGDEYEQESDRVAEQVMRMPDVPVDHETSSTGGGPLVQGRAGETSEAGTGVAPPIVHDLLSSPGQPLDAATRAFFEPRFGHNFGNVRVHSGATADQSARQIHAKAFTMGHDVVLGGGQHAPQTPAGQKLLAHELTHVVQQGQMPAPVVLRKVTPEDVVSEMVGQNFIVSGPLTVGKVSFAGGELVQVMDWSNIEQEVKVKILPPHASANQIILISKTRILPKPSNVPGIAPYSAGAATKAQAVERAEQQLAAEKTRAGGPRPGEIPRISGLLPTHWESLNRKLIQETMFNKLDESIRLWTDYYNIYWLEDPLDPNLVKSMLYQESRMGTSGKHLELVPIWDVRSRFNVGQAVDSAGSALLIMMREMAPELITDFHLENIETDLEQAQQDLENLPKKTTRTPDEEHRLAELQFIQSLEEAQHMRFSELFLLSYKAPGQTRGFDDAATRFFNVVETGHPRRGADYDFWVRMAVRWLFEKRPTVGSWAEAVRAYNGLDKGPGYRNLVTGRASAAKKTSASGKPFVPEDLNQ